MAEGIRINSSRPVTKFFLRPIAASTFKSLIAMAELMNQYFKEVV
jgi:hypothetical protein